MSAYRVEIDDEGCPSCQHDQTFYVIGPDDMASSVSYGDREDAESLARQLDRAYELGRKSVSPNSADAWTAFAPDSMPPDTGGVSLLVWDSQFNIVSAIYYMASQYTPEYLANMSFTHWRLASSLVGPRVLTTQPPTIQAAPDSVDPPVIQPPAPIDTSVQREQWDDDIPF